MYYLSDKKDANPVQDLKNGETLSLRYSLRHIGVDISLSKPAEPHCSPSFCRRIG